MVGLEKLSHGTGVGSELSTLHAMNLRSTPVDEHELDSLAIVDAFGGAVKTIKDELRLHLRLHLRQTTLTSSNENEVLGGVFSTIVVTDKNPVNQVGIVANGLDGRGNSIVNVDGTFESADSATVRATS